MPRLYRWLLTHSFRAALLPCLAAAAIWTVVTWDSAGSSQRIGVWIAALVAGTIGGLVLRALCRVADRMLNREGADDRPD
jgi:hypothetical protein